MGVAKLNYKSSGVDIKAADRFVRSISDMVRSTYDKNVKSTVGGYASLYSLNSEQMIAATTDGVGTKLKLAFELKKYDTIGIDLVAMSVNDLICVGARPLFFLDYFATGKLKPKQAESVIRGIADGCLQAGCALVGGETAEMPDFYPNGEFDLGGFAVGLVEKKKLLPQKISPGDVILGLAASGAHSNGYSLLRKLLKPVPADRKWKKLLLEPTRIYVQSVLPLMERGWIKGASHITGSGFLNLLRLSAPSSRLIFDLTLPHAEERAEVFQWVKKESGLSLDERARTFNLGIGMILICKQEHKARTMRELVKKGETVWELGRVSKSRGSAPSSVRIQEANDIAELR
jgi:phosphoribosylformylglycinamidine cyclo-ligase